MLKAINRYSNPVLKANIQDKLKALAIFSMIIDHVGLFFFPTIEIFRVIGRLAMPIFCFFIGYNFKGKRKSILLKFGFLLMTIMFINDNSIFTLNILFTIYLGQFYLQKIHTLTDDFISNVFQIFPLVVFTPATFLFFDYGTLAIAIMALGYSYRYSNYNHKKYIFMISSLTILYSQIVFWFDLHNFICLVIICIIFFYLLTYYDNYDSKIEASWVVSLSRNSLFIYFSHICLFQIIVTIMNISNLSK